MLRTVQVRLLQKHEQDEYVFQTLKSPAVANSGFTLETQIFVNRDCYTATRSSMVSRVAYKINACLKADALEMPPETL
jgi:hypothetical protein